MIHYDGILIAHKIDIKDRVTLKPYDTVVIFLENITERDKNQETASLHIKVLALTFISKN